jgi:hypothetical protein
MEDQFVTYEQALALKELGFNEPCIYQYVRDFDNDGDLIPIVSDLNLHILRNNTEISDNSGGDCFAAPLKQQVFKWFREEHKLSSIIFKEHLHYWFEIEYDDCEEYTNNGFNSFEDAESSCIDKLIELIK